MVNTNDNLLIEIKNFNHPKRRAGEKHGDRGIQRCLCSLTNILLQRMPEKESPLLLKITRAHAKNCETCSQDMEALLLVSAFFETESPLLAPSDLSRSVMERIENMLRNETSPIMNATDQNLSNQQVSDPIAGQESFNRFKKRVLPATAFAALTLGVFIGWFIRWLQYHGRFKKAEIGRIAAFAGNK